MSITVSRYHHWPTAGLLSISGCGLSAATTRLGQTSESDRHGRPAPAARYYSTTELVLVLEDEEDEDEGW